MENSHYQPELIGSGAQNLGLRDAEIEYIPGFLDTDDAWQLFESLLMHTDWRQEQITLFGKTHPVPRLSCWMADAGLDYTYSNMTMHPVPWSEALMQIKLLLQSRTGHAFNSVLLNYYRDGSDSNGWHSDDEPELGPEPVIASISLGGVRDFQLRHKGRKAPGQTLRLNHGSLLLMSGRTQACWQHQVPKRAQAEPRINLTFRIIKPCL